MSKLLSQGGFGCVYYPGIRCKNSKDDDDMIEYVTKLQRNNFNSQNEAAIGLRIKKDVIYKYFFLPVVSECPVKMATFSKDNEDLVSKCEVIKDTDKDYTLMKIPYANNKPIMEQIFDNMQDKKHMVISILEAYTHVLKGIEYLIDLKIVHFDLKSDNILYDSDMNHANIIDFGLSIPIDKITPENIKEYFYLYAPEYYLWPLEIHIINYLLHELGEGEEEVANIAERIAEEYVSSNKGLEMFSDEFAKSFKETCRRQVENVLGDFDEDSHRKIINGLIENYATWDNYAVSIMNLRLIHLLFPDGFPENQFYIDFTQLLLTNIHPDPTRRMSVAETRQRFYELFYLNENIDTYIKMIEDITVDTDRVKSLVSRETDTLNSAIEKTES